VTFDATHPASFDWAAPRESWSGDGPFTLVSSSGSFSGHFTIGVNSQSHDCAGIVAGIDGSGTSVSSNLRTLNRGDPPIQLLAPSGTPFAISETCGSAGSAVKATIIFTSTASDSVFAGSPAHQALPGG
jgi:hypothetical protein